MEFKKILVPVDGSETAEKAFKVGLDMAIKHNAELFLLYVADMNDAAYPVLQVTLDENGFISMRKKAEEVLSNLKAQIPVGTRLTALVKIGDPGRVIPCRRQQHRHDHHGKPRQRRHFLLHHGKRQPVCFRPRKMPRHGYQIN